MGCKIDKVIRHPLYRIRFSVAAVDRLVPGRVDYLVEPAERGLPLHGTALDGPRLADPRRRGLRDAQGGAVGDEG